MVSLPSAHCLAILKKGETQKIQTMNLSVIHHSGCDPVSFSGASKKSFWCPPQTVHREDVEFQQETSTSYLTNSCLSAEHCNKFTAPRHSIFGLRYLSRIKRFGTSLCPSLLRAADFLLKPLPNLFVAWGT